MPLAEAISLTDYLVGIGPGHVALGQLHRCWFWTFTGGLINPKLSRKRAPSRGEMVTKAHAVAVQPVTPWPRWHWCPQIDLGKEESQKIWGKAFQNMEAPWCYCKLLLLIWFLYMIMKCNNHYGEIVSCCSSTLVSYELM